MKVEIWSDVVCPWCYIGKRRFEAALARFAHRDELKVTWRAFELDPAAPREREGDLADHLASKYGVSRAEAQRMHESMSATAAGEGLTFRFDRARPGNTFDAHRLLHLAADRGVQDAVKERLLCAYLTDGEPIGDPQTLVRLGVEAGLDRDEAASVLGGDRYAAEVRADESEAHALGANAVPFFVINRRYGIAGAQPAELIRETLDKAWVDDHPLTVVAAGGSPSDACVDGGCAV